MATKTTSVRAEEENIERFDKLAEEYNITKTDLFPQLLEAYEEKKLKEKVPGRADEMDAFKVCLKQLHDLYDERALQEPEDQSSEEYDEWTESLEDLDDLIDDIHDRLDSL